MGLFGCYFHWYLRHGFCHGNEKSNLSMLFRSGSQNPSGAEKDGPVQGHLRLRQTHPEGRGSVRVLQRLRPQHAGHHPVRRHRPGRV